MLLPLEVPGATIGKSLTTKNAADAPGIDVDVETALMGKLNALGHGVTVKAMVMLGEGKDDIVETQPDHVIEITLNVLRIPNPEVTNPELHTATFW